MKTFLRAVHKKLASLPPLWCAPWSGSSPPGCCSPAGPGGQRARTAPPLPALPALEAVPSLGPDCGVGISRAAPALSHGAAREESFCAEGGEGVARVAQRGGGCPVPGNVQGQPGWGSEQADLVEEVPTHGRGGGWMAFTGPIQPKPVCNSLSRDAGEHPAPASCSGADAVPASLHPASPCSAPAGSLSSPWKPRPGSRVHLQRRRLRSAPCATWGAGGVPCTIPREGAVQRSISGRYLGHPGVLLPPGTSSFQPLLGSLRLLVSSAAPSPSPCPPGAGLGGAGVPSREWGLTPWVWGLCANPEGCAGLGVPQLVQGP